MTQETEMDRYLSQAERFKRMGEELCREDVCITCGGREINGQCDTCRRLGCDA